MNDTSEEGDVLIVNGRTGWRGLEHIRLEHNTTKQALNTANLSDVSNLKPSQLLPLIRSSLVDSPSHNNPTT